MAAQVSMREAATRLGLSVDTVRRRLHSGELVGHQEPIRNGTGFRWLVEVPEAPDLSSLDSEPEPLTRVSEVCLVCVAKDRHIATLDEQLAARNRDIEQLHILMGRSSLAAPVQDDSQDPGSVPPRPWWRFWQ